MSIEKRTATKVSAWEPPDGGRKRWYVTYDDGSEALTWDSKVAEAIPIGKETTYDLAPPKQEGWKPSITWLPDVLGQKPARGAGGGGGRPPRDEALIQERMDRRTALMQAVIVAGDKPSMRTLLSIGDRMYAWLRSQATETPSSPDRAGETPARSLDTPEPRPTTSEPPVAEAPSGKAAQGPAGGEANGEGASPPVPDIDPELFTKPASEEQWARAAKLFGTKGLVMRNYVTRFSPDKPVSTDDVSAGELALLISEKVS